jgi:hypothetical protein
MYHDQEKSREAKAFAVCRWHRFGGCLGLCLCGSIKRVRGLLDLVINGLETILGFVMFHAFAQSVEVLCEKENPREQG